MSEQFTTPFYLDDIEFEVTANFSPGEPQTYWEPGCPDDVECESISFAGEKLSNIQMNFLIESYGEKEFEEWLLEEANNAIQDRQAEYGEYLYEQMKDRELERSL